MSLATAEQVAHGNAWDDYESDLDERDFLENKQVEKYEEIRKDATLMHEAMIHLYLSGDDGKQIVESASHAMDLAATGGSNQAIIEAAAGFDAMRDKAASMYAKHKVEQEFIN